jgi:predicted HicB family RNase H-like nuclease
VEIQYKGYIGKILFSADTTSFYGEVINSENLIAFQAPNPQSAIQAMQEAVDHYLTYMSPTETLAVETEH